jgi:hypothetical protein
MIFGFTTRSSAYYFDDQRMVAWGGKLGTMVKPVQFSSVRINNGEKAVITLANGKVVTTGVVESLL